MEKVSASGDFSAGHLLVADGADVIESFEFLSRRFRQRVDLLNSSAPFDENTPAGTCLTPNVKISMDAHHDGSYGASRLKDQNPRTVEKEENTEAELHLKYSVEIINQLR